MIENSCRPKP